jgi:hypothetical protein
VVLPSVPSFALITTSIAGAIALVTLSAFLLMIQLSKRQFSRSDDTTATPKFHVAMKRILKKGRLANRAFFYALTVQFFFATCAILLLNEYRYVSDQRGLAAQYHDRSKTEIEVFMDLIPVCNWGDRFDQSELDAVWRDSGGPTRGSIEEFWEDRALREFETFAVFLSEAFRTESPAAVQRLNEQLNPVFAILSLFFLVCVRSVVRHEEDPETYTLTVLVSSGLLAVSFAMLGYFVVLAYHAAVEVSAAFAAGRIVCVAHVAPYFVAQSQALAIAAITMLAAFAMAPSPILRRI